MLLNAMKFMVTKEISSDETSKKRCYKLLGDVRIHVTEFHLFFMQQSIITVFEDPERILRIALRPTLIKEISSVQNLKEPF